MIFIWQFALPDACRRMNAIAPNLTVMVGELVGARLIAHAGRSSSSVAPNGLTLHRLAAEPGQVPGLHCADPRRREGPLPVRLVAHTVACAHSPPCSALKTKHDTPKYGLLYHASVVGAAQAKNKGKMSRVLAAKAVLTVRRWPCVMRD